jgi:proteasome lid subunit RPN8/RPN11
MHEFFQPIYDPPSSHPSRLRPATNKELVCFASVRSGFEVYIHRSVLNAIECEAARARPHETIGLLAGRFWQDNQGDYTVILAIEGAQDGEIDASPSHVRISAAGNARVRNRLEANYIAYDIVGWYHSHPTFPPTFSLTDMEEQTTWKDRDSVGIVYSGLPASKPFGEFGVYQGPDGEKLSWRLSPPEPRPTRKLELPEGNGGQAASHPVTHVLERGPREGLTKSLADWRNINFPLWVFAFGVIGLLVGILWASYRTQRIEAQIVSLLDDFSRQRPQRGPAGEVEPSGTSKQASAGEPPPAQDPATQPPQQKRAVTRNKQASPLDHQQRPRHGGNKPRKTNTPANKKSSTETANKAGVKPDNGPSKPQNKRPS